MNAYDSFIKDEILPAINNSLKAEDARFREEIENSDFKDNIYEYDDKNLTASVITERTLQYFIYRDLCKKFKIWPEESVYKNTKKRVDLAIYKNITDYQNKDSEIAIEIKKIRFNKQGLFKYDCFNALMNDIKKLKRASNKNKYLLLIGLYDKAKLNQEVLRLQFQKSIEKRRWRNYNLGMLDVMSFKTNGDEGFNDYIIMVWKLTDN